MNEEIDIEKLQNEIYEHLEILDSYVKSIPKLGKESMESSADFFWFDVYVIGLLNRSVNIISGFITLMREGNFIAAAPLVRVHLDSLLRLFAPQLIDYNVDEFAKKIYGGKKLDEIKDKDKNKLKDFYLATKLAENENFEWVTHVYKAGSSHVHFSDKSIFAALQLNDKNRTMGFTIGLHDNFVGIEDKHGATYWMNLISEGIVLLTMNWIKQKRREQK